MSALDRESERREKKMKTKERVEVRVVVAIGTL